MPKEDEIYFFKTELNTIINLSAEIATSLRRTKFESIYRQFEAACLKLYRRLEKLDLNKILNKQEIKGIYETIEMGMLDIQGAYARLHSPPMEELDPYLTENSIINNRKTERILGEITLLDRLYTELQNFSDIHKTGNLTPVRNAIRSVTRIFG